MGRPTTRIDVVVPAHDEHELIGACLEALRLARDRLLGTEPGVEVGVVVVLDASTDGTAEVVATSGLATTVVEIAEQNVGAARRAGAEAAVASPTSVPDAHRWLATTDADSRVDPSWLAVHLDALTSGVDVLLGTVRPDFDDLDEDGRRRWLETHPPGHLPGNVHGANLGVRLDAYRRIGGFAALAEHEDVDLVARARLADLDVRATLAAPVITSGRRIGRTPGGYAAFLASAYGARPARA
ncbi:GT2 family glycosyltransferase [Labedella gwakjiensis]|uniref:4,4'-diaponeurosporenoate glycosyltransferase n=1 Tax=Labedella gwakjiensis TaxID=390269 RepID=A0A2P8GTI2_9MICO|nr:glycosyltransferase [Labedella gwakjiensis]PSL37270.1 GT2 family glycosyltransferase [Labedella gwakjiensis]